MDLDHFSADQRHILDEQTQNPFSFALFNAWITPDTWKICRQGKQLLPSSEKFWQNVTLVTNFFLCYQLLGLYAAWLLNCSG